MDHLLSSDRAIIKPLLAPVKEICRVERQRRIGRRSDRLGLGRAVPPPSALPLRAKSLAARVQSGPGSPAKPDEVDKHLRRVAQQANLGGRIIIPADRNFNQLAAQVLDKEKHLGIEPEAGRALKLEGAPRSRAAKKLQAALRVADFEAR